jgi:FMN phosphatase YigB (HAD superfamily)
MTHNALPSPILVLDVDEVLLDYVFAFSRWAHSLGIVPAVHPHEENDYTLCNLFPDRSSAEIRALIEAFSKHDDYAYMPEIPGARSFVHRARNKYPDMRVVCVTACGDDPVTRHMRCANLVDFPVDGVVILPLGATKLEVYGRLGADGSPLVVVDDRPKHVDEAISLGHRGFLFDRPTNRTVDHSARIHGYEALLARMGSAFGLSSGAFGDT